MKIFSILQLSLAAAVFFLNASLSHAAVDNTTVAGAVNYRVGQGWVSHYFDEATQERWFVFEEEAQRSYCIEVTKGSATYYDLSLRFIVYEDDSDQAEYLNSGASSSTGARLCYGSILDNGSILRAIKINVPINSSSEENGFIKLRIIETSYTGQCFSVSKDSVGYPKVSSYVSLFNTSNKAINFSIYLKNYGKISQGGIGSEQTAGLSFSSSINQNFPPNGVALKGAINIVHNGLPGSLTGSITTSATGGTTTETCPIISRF